MVRASRLEDRKEKVNGAISPRSGANEAVPRPRNEKVGHSKAHV